MSQAVEVIYIIWSGAIGGRQKCALNLAKHLDRAKYSPRVWCLADGGPIADDCVRAGIPVEIIGWRELFAPHGAWRLWKLLREHSAAILHLHTLERRLLSLVRTMRDARVVLHHHGHLSAEISDARWNRILSLRGAIQVCDAQWMARTLRERVKLDAPIFAVPVAVELDRFASASAERGERLRAELGGAPLVGWVGRLSREKGCDLFLESARIIQGKIPAAKFCVVGDGALRGKLEQLAGRLGIASAVSFLGMRDDVPDLLAAMDVLVLSSREEGLPFIVIEAMAARRPVAAFDLEGVREIVGVEAGVLTPPENAEALASAVVELLGAPDRRARLAEAGQRRARELFDIEKVTRQMEAIYDGVLSAKSNA